MLQPDGNKRVPPGTSRASHSLGVTVAQIAADLSIANGSLSVWLRASGVPIRRSG